MCSLTRQYTLSQQENNNNSDNGQLADELTHCEPINGIAVPQDDELTAITNFANEACDQVSIRATGHVRLSEMRMDTDNVEDIKNYFSRPIVVANISYTTGYPVPLKNINITNAYLQSTLYNFARIKGAFGYRATVCFRLQAVANPFQAGILRMALSPMQQQSYGNSFDRTVSRAFVSQLPGVELDLAESTSCILKVPFIHPLNYFTVQQTTTTETLGILTVYPYTDPALATGDISPRLALWMWLEDFELIGATAAEFSSQSGMPRKKATTSKEESAIPGNLSNVLAAGSRFATWAGTKIPLLSSYAGPTSWFMRQAAHIAASYGWARPLNVSPNNKVIISNNVYQNNSDGPDPSFNLGMFSDNTVAPLPGFAGSMLDEMAFDYLTGVYTAISARTLSVGDSIGGYVHVRTLSPSSMYYASAIVRKPIIQGSPAPGLSIIPSPLFALGNTFFKWRGGFKFRVKIGKTKFHTGRLILGFVPNPPRIDATKAYYPTDPTNMQYKSAIWDLRESNTMEFECPFTSNEQYLPWDTSFGSFFIAVLDPLAGPPSVAQSVTLIVEVAGMPDFEFAQPCAPRYPLSPVDATYSSQSGLNAALEVDNSMTPSLFCIGEKINTIKQMVSRAGLVKILTSSGSYVIETTLNSPYWSPAKPAAPTSLILTDNTYLNYFQAFYAMSRGGYHVHAIPLGTDITMSITDQPDGQYAGSTLITESSCALHVKVPYYNQRSRDMTFDSFVAFGPSTQTLLNASMKTGSLSKVLVFTRAADEYQLGYFIGAPPLAIPFQRTTETDDLADIVLTTDH